MPVFEPDPEIEATVEGEAPARSKRQADDAAVADRIAAQREAAEARRYALQLARSTADANFREFNSRMELAQRDYQEADEVGDSEKKAEAQGRMVTFDRQREEARGRLNYLNSQPDPQISDPVERMASTLTPKSADWVRRNPDVVNDRELYSRMMAGHHMAVGAGIPVESDQYFDAIERTVRGGRRHQEPTESYGAPQDHVVVRRGDADGNSVRMSKNAYEMATKVLTWNYDDPDGKFRKGDPIGVREYLRRQNEMRKQGYMDRLG